jgi:hypothetical protein
MRKSAKKIQITQRDLKYFKMGEEAFHRGAKFEDNPLRGLKGRERDAENWGCGLISAQTDHKKKP